MSEEIAAKVITSIVKVKKVRPDDVTLNSTFEELKLDSLDGLDVFFELEEAFDLTIPDDRARSLHSVGSVVEEIERLLAKRNGNAG